MKIRCKKCGSFVGKKKHNCKSIIKKRTTHWIKGQKAWNKGLPMKKLFPNSGFQKNNKFGNIGVDKSFERIVNESKKLKRKGYRVIPIGKVIPDIIAIKNNKVYAIEVEFGIPNYSKYDKNDYKKYFDEIKWIIKKKRK